MINEIQLFYQLKRAYFRQFWSYVQWGIILSSWFTLLIYIWHHQEIDRVGTLFEQTHGYVYMNLQMAANVTDLLTLLLGLCCFCATIKLLRFSRYSRHLSLYGDTIKHASQELLSSTLIFLIIFAAFVILFYLLFTPKMRVCASLFQTAQMLFEMVLLKFNASELSSGDALLGPLCLALFVFFVVFVSMTMFISIVQRSFRTTRKNGNTNENGDHEMMAYMWDRLQRSTGMRKADERDLFEERDKRMRGRYVHRIEDFSQNAD